MVYSDLYVHSVELTLPKLCLVSRFRKLLRVYYVQTLCVTICYCGLLHYLIFLVTVKG